MRKEESVRTKDRAIRSMRTITIATILVLLASNLFWVYRYDRTINEKLQYSFVATDMGTFMISRNPDTEMQQYEVGNFVDRFLTLLLQYDANTLEKNLTIALEWVGNEELRRKLFTDYVDGGVIDRIKEYDSSTVFEIDSIKVDTKVRPVVASVYGVQYTLTQGQKIPQSVGARMEVEQVGSGRRERTRKNAWGISVSKLQFFAYDKGQISAGDTAVMRGVPEIIEEN